LTWENNSTSATGFTIERSADGGATFTAVGAADGDATSYNDTGLSPGTDYTYQVVATTSSQNSAASASADAVTLPASPPLPQLRKSICPGPTSPAPPATKSIAKTPTATGRRSTR
jgi:hypothetical protein